MGGEECLFIVERFSVKLIAKELGPVIPILTGISRRIISGQKFLLSERQRERIEIFALMSSWYGIKGIGLKPIKVSLGPRQTFGE